MKCRSVACLWSGAPPSHRVTATAALNEPPTLYTGGCDGSIIWWNLFSSSSASNSDMKPIAMLCGHAAPIADLEICYPIGSGDEKTTNYLSNVAVNTALDSCGSLISACTDGVLCIWSRSSGHCRRRRKLPPWVGSPSIVCTLPSNPRYVCVGCCFIDVAHLSDPHYVDSVEGIDVSESPNRKPPKCTVVIVDSYTLTIVQTVFHGNLAIGPFKFMSVVQLAEDRDNHSVLIGDSFGRLQLVPISKDTYPEAEATSNKNSSQFEIAAGGNDPREGENVVSTIIYQNIVALLLNKCCIFRLLSSGVVIGEISFEESILCIECDSSQSYVSGGMFLGTDTARNTSSTSKGSEIISEKFVVWNNRGSAILYSISYVNDIFKCELLGEIPAVSHPLDVKLLFYFIQLRHYLLRVKSVCFDTQEPFQWRPHVTMWSLHQEHDETGMLRKQCRMVGEGVYVLNLNSSYSLQHKLPSGQSSAVCTENLISEQVDHNNAVMQKRNVVSSSMVISENLYVPYAVVYGFFSGEIEVVRFDLLHALDASAGSPRLEKNSLLSRQYFLGHTGPVLCLAAHRMLGTARGQSFNQVLVSGSKDCTIRIWDLDTGNLITIMHHHVAPIRQIILPPAQTQRPWNDCFLSVGEDACVALSSLETLRVERMFPGHPNYPAKVVWDGARGYIACLCQQNLRASDAIDFLYIWDIKTGARERILRGAASNSMFDHFCKGISMNSISGTVLNGNTSVSTLHLPINEDVSYSQPYFGSPENGATLSNRNEKSAFRQNINKESTGKEFPIKSSDLLSKRYPIKCSCPFPGFATLIFDLASLTFPCQKHELMVKEFEKEVIKERRTETPSPNQQANTINGGSPIHIITTDSTEELDWIKALGEYLIRFSLSFLHLWNIDYELDQLLITEMKLLRPENFIVASGLQGDKGSLTLTFPDMGSILELWKSSSEFCAMRSLTMVSLAQCLISLSHSTSAASSALAAFYTRNFADKFPDIKPPLLQLLMSFWQDESEHVRMAARSLFHCAASRAIPLPLCSHQTSEHTKLVRSLSGIGENEDGVLNVGGTSVNGLESASLQGTEDISQVEEAKLLAWLESFEMQDWISCVGGTSQDAMASHITVAATLAIWYPSLVNPSLAMLVVHPLMKLVMAMNEKYSSTAAELLAEGMENTWKACIGSEIPHLIADIFFQIECVSGQSSKSRGQHPVVPLSIREILVDVLLPSLAMADILGFLTVIESQIWSTASDSPVHLVSLMTLIRVVRGSPRNLAQYLDKVVNFILQTMEPGNSVMRRTCLLSSMSALKEVVRVFPMVALNDGSTRLAVGDAIGEINNASVRVYDMLSVVKVKVLDASGPPGLPSLLAGTSETVATTAISALSFSPGGEGLVAFSEHGLMIRWWSLGSVWWEKLSRNFVPAQCTKVIFVPPWEGYSPNTSRSSVMASIMGHEQEAKLQENAGTMSHTEHMKQLIHNIDLSYRLEWVAGRKLLLTRHGIELGIFQL